MNTESDDAQTLLAYVSRRDMPCPRCGYNVRGLTQPRCPECGEPLRLTVGAARPIFGILLMAMAPGIFSGIAAIIFGLEKVLFPTARPGWMWFVYGFGALSGLVALGLYRCRTTFLRRSSVSQYGVAAAIWVLHLVAFGIVAWFY